MQRRQDRCLPAVRSEAVKVLWRLVHDFHPLDYGALGSVAAPPDSRIYCGRRALEYRLDPAVWKVFYPPVDAQVLRDPNRRRAEEHPLHHAAYPHVPTHRPGLHRRPRSLPTFAGVYSRHAS